MNPKFPLEWALFPSLINEQLPVGTTKAWWRILRMMMMVLAWTRICRRPQTIDGRQADEVPFVTSPMTSVVHEVTKEVLCISAEVVIVNESLEVQGNFCVCKVSQGF